MRDKGQSLWEDHGMPPNMCLWSCDCSRRGGLEALGFTHSSSFTEVVKGTDFDGLLLRYLLSTVGLPKAPLAVLPGTNEITSTCYILQGREPQLLLGSVALQLEIIFSVMEEVRKPWLRIPVFKSVLAPAFCFGCFLSGEMLPELSRIRLRKLLVNHDCLLQRLVVLKTCALLKSRPHLRWSEEVEGEMLEGMLAVQIVSLCKAATVWIIMSPFSSCQAREAEYEAEQEKIRKEKEKEIARLRALQEKAQDYRAEQVSTSSPSPLSFVPPTPGSHPLTACKVACRVEV